MHAYLSYELKVNTNLHLVLRIMLLEVSLLITKLLLCHWSDICIIGGWLVSAVNVYGT